MAQRLTKTAAMYQRRYVSELVNLSLAGLALPVAFLLRFDLALDSPYGPMLVRALALVVGIKWLVFRVFSLRDLAWRYLGFDDLLRLAGANFGASVVSAALLRAVLGRAFPRSIYFLDLIVSMGFMMLARAGARLWFDFRNIERQHLTRKPAKYQAAVYEPRFDKLATSKYLGSSLRTWFRIFHKELDRNAPASRQTARRILIYGAGRAGRRILEEIRCQPQMNIQVAGFLDDDLTKQRLQIGGVRVVGTGEELPAAAERLRANEIWLALPLASGSQMAAILDRCQRAKIPVQRIPPLAEIVQSRVLLEQLREVLIEDLLERPPIHLDESGAPGNVLIAGKVVLVTGAGGSIGSELCRQIARAGPLALIGLDQGETALYQIDQQIREQHPGLVFYPEIASIQNPRRLEEIFARHRPQLVFHAAAYKHVPMMEAHIFEAVENNVFGTCNLAHAARAHGACSFVLISSDKAVRPTNIMGATKRLAELVCLGSDRAGDRGQDLPDRSLGATANAGPDRDSRGTRFLAVRFGNVLGSNGSVIPLFRRQIAAGGPITVTHPEMRRYFMTIPEAVQLVLQAAELGAGGEIFVLDMGAPVKIVDLARKMVLLSGLRPGEDIHIEFSGIRPGEKLFEELHHEDEDTQPTPHPKIRVYRARQPENPLNVEDLATSGLPPQTWFESLRLSVANRDLASTILCLKGMIPGYSPSIPLLRQALGKTKEPLQGKAAGA